MAFTLMEAVNKMLSFFYEDDGLPKDWNELLQGKGLPHVAINIINRLVYNDVVAILQANPKVLKEEKEDFKRIFQVMKVQESLAQSSEKDIIAETETCLVLTVPRMSFHEITGFQPLRMSRVVIKREMITVHLSDGQKFVFSEKEGKHIPSLFHSGMISDYDMFANENLSLRNWGKQIIAYSWTKARGYKIQACKWEEPELEDHPAIYAGYRNLSIVQDNRLYQVWEKNNIITTIWLSLKQIPDHETWNSTNIVSLQTDGKWKAGMKLREEDVSPIDAQANPWERSITKTRPVVKEGHLAAFFQCSGQGLIWIFELASGKRLGKVCQFRASRNPLIEESPSPTSFSNLSMDLTGDENLIVGELKTGFAASWTIKVYNWRNGSLLWENMAAGKPWLVDSTNNRKYIALVYEDMKNLRLTLFLVDIRTGKSVTSFPHINYDDFPQQWKTVRPPMRWVDKNVLVFYNMGINQVGYHSHLHTEMLLVKNTDSCKNCSVRMRKDFGTVEGTNGELFWETKDWRNIERGTKIKIFKWKQFE